MYLIIINNLGKYARLIVKKISVNLRAFSLYTRDK